MWNSTQLTMGVIVLAAAATAPAQESSTKPGQLATRWAEDVSSKNALPEYPRPQMQREGWTNLNGEWEYAIRPRRQAAPTQFDGKILVPFPVESQLSGVGKTVTPRQHLWYRRSFQANKPKDNGRLLLHFGAVDWQSTIWVNGKQVGEHSGGYDPFTFDITDALANDGTNELLISVWDPTDSQSFARGKQVGEPRGIWYTAVTGIWQTVWLEEVPEASIAAVKITPDVDSKSVRIGLDLRIHSDSPGGLTRWVTIRAGNSDVILKRFRTNETEIALSEPEIALDEPHLWSPDDPFLYDLTIELRRGNQVVDRVDSYFGMRKIEIREDDHGHNRLYLNGTALFQYGPLDQGWWPDGLYTAPTDEALRYDIEVTKDLGFNMIRKHVKVEPARWYYWCDKLGVLVWQDMPSAMKRNGGEHVAADSKEDPERDPEAARQFESELKRMIDWLHNHPSIVMWVPFNEGWGQYDTGRIADVVKSWDPTRLVNCPSGWTDRGVGDVLDFHNYPGPTFESAGPGRVAILGEFGGLGWPVEGHLWGSNRNWGYRTYYSREELLSHYKEVVGSVAGLIGKGLAAAVYTQTTDVEGEVNGLLTYDREMVKLPSEELQALHASFYGPAPGFQELAPASANEPQDWRVTQEKPGSNWADASFNDTGWESAPGPFVLGENAFLNQGTTWKSGDLWLRREFNVDELPTHVGLQLYQEVRTAEIYLNGQLLRNLEEPRPTKRHYQFIELPESGSLLKKGRNVLAVHCAKPGGPRSFDLGLYGVVVAQAAAASTTGAQQSATRRPNIVFAFADDWGRYASAYAKIEPGGPSDIVQTPHFDRVAQEGVLFTHAYVNAPSCTPCRSSLLSGQYFWRTGRGAILQGAIWDLAIPSYPLILQEQGYHIGHTYKVWSPGTPANAPYGAEATAYNSAGRNFNRFSQTVSGSNNVEAAKQKLLDEVEGNFQAFLNKRENGQPFCYWFGPTNCHRKWTQGSGKNLWGLEPDDLEGKMPAFLPDVPIVRQDFCDYLGEVQAFDAGLGVLIQRLEELGELENTIIVVSGDHGIPGFPRGKCNLYDFGVHVPLAIRWGTAVPGGRVVDDFVSLTDIAPTLVDAAGFNPPAVMTGRSLVNVLKSGKSGYVDSARDYVITGRERHVAAARLDRMPYPQRAIRTKDFLYIRNFKPERWPMGIGPGAGQPAGPMPPYVELREDTFVAFGDLDASPTKAWIATHKSDPGMEKYYDYAFGRRPGEELYDLRNDPDCLKNLAQNGDYSQDRQRLSTRLMSVLSETGDPRVTGDGGTYDRPPFTVEYRR